MPQEYNTVERFIGHKIAELIDITGKGVRISGWDIELPNGLTQVEKDECRELLDYVFNSLGGKAATCLLFGIYITEARHQGIEYSRKVPVMVEEGYIGKAFRRFKGLWEAS